MPTMAPTAANAKMQSGTTHAAHQVTTAKGHSSGAGLASVQSPTLPRLLEVWWLTTTSVAAWATVLRACVQTLNGMGTAVTQALPACAGMPTIGSAGTFHLRRLHEDGCNAGGISRAMCFDKGTAVGAAAGDSHSLSDQCSPVHTDLGFAGFFVFQDTFAFGLLKRLRMHVYYAGVHRILRWSPRIALLVCAPNAVCSNQLYDSAPFVCEIPC